MDPTIVARVVLVLVTLGVVVGGVGGLGFALGRFFARREGHRPTLPDDPVRRLRLLEEELEQVQSDLARLREEREFQRRLARGPDTEPQSLGRGAA